MLRDMARHPLYGLGLLVLPSTPLWFIGRALSAEVPKIAYIGCLVAALLAFLFMFLPAARGLPASADSPVAELSCLSAEFRKGDGSMELWASSDEWELSGVD